MLNKRIAVLMSTYNGEKFIREQLDSILNQKNADITLYIRDDGSKDGTVGIIREYMKSNSCIHFMNDNKNLRPGASFMKLLVNVVKKEEKFDFYAFADQDDIWLEDKLSAAAEKVGETDKPVLYCSNQYIYKNGNNEGIRFTETPDLSIVGHVTKNEIYGCTMVMNYALAKVITDKKMPSKKYLDLRCHDSWVLHVAMIAGEVIFDENAYILYRIHENNTIGIVDRSLSERIKRFVGGVTKNNRQECAEMLLENFPDEEFPERKYLEEFAYYRKSLKKRLGLIADRKICKGKKESSFLFVIKVIFGYV